jgi:hypothetical protein
MLLFSLANCQNRREEKYARWNGHLKAHQVDYQAVINESVRLLHKQVSREGNTQEGKERLNRASEMLKATYALLIYVDSLENEIRKTPENNLQNLIIGEKSNGKAYKLQSKLRTFQIWLLQKNADLGYIQADFQRIISDTLILTLYGHLQYKKWSFIETNFKNIAKSQMLANVLTIKHQILFCADDILKKLGGGIGDNSHNYNFPMPMAIAEADTIAQGFDYQAIMFYSSIPNRVFQLVFDNKIIPSNDNRITHNVRFKVSGEGEKSWQAQIKCKNSYTLNDSIFSFSQKYYVLPN